MSLRDRLIKFDPFVRRAAPRGVRPASEPCGATPGALRVADDANLCAALNLEPSEGRTGGIWSRQSSLFDMVRPCWPLPDLRAIMTGFQPELEKPAETLASLQDVLFLDTETTGLAAGTGSFAFLVGLGWWDGDVFMVRQLFLPGPHREPALLEDLATVTERFRAVVTYNGAAFDLPLLRTRARLNRHPDPCADLVSWDLLKAARRLWGRELRDCCQQTVERMICAYGRGPGDIAGNQIPGVYRAFLRAGEIKYLKRVLYHNQRDIEGLGLVFAAMTAAASGIADGPSSWRGSAQAAWSNLLICERRRQRQRAADWAGWILTCGHLSSLPLAGVLDMIRQLKRVADWPLVAAAIEHGLVRWPDEKRLHYEAAVLYEHRLGDARQALGHALILKDERRLVRLRSRLTHLRSDTCLTL